MYTIIISFDNLTEVYNTTDYNEEIKTAIESITLYGEDCVELVFEGSPVVCQHNISSFKEVVKRFKEETLFDTYFEESERETVDNQLNILSKVAL